MRDRDITGISDTSERLKAAAIHLFATNGLDAVSVRDIAAAANLKNATSLNYYFRSKDELIRQIVEEVMGLANAHWKAGLDELLDQTKSPPIRDVIRVIVSWSNAKAPPSAARFLAMFVHVRREALRAMIRELGYGEFDRAFALIRAAMKGIAGPVVEQRLIFLFWSVSAFLGAREASMDARHADDHSVWSATDVVENFSDAMAAMLTAPTKASVPPRKIRK